MRYTETVRARGRTETRSIKAMSASSKALFPHRRQIFRIERTVTRRARPDSRVEAYGITGRSPLDADAPDLARVMVTVRNTAISLLKLTGWANIAQATWHSPHRSTTAASSRPLRTHQP